MSGYRLPRRCMTAFLVVLSLLFSQLALASYVCPGAADAASTAGMAMAPGEPQLKALRPLELERLRDELLRLALRVAMTHPPLWILRH